MCDSDIDDPTAGISPSVEINVHNNGNSQITRKESTRTDGSRQIDLYIEIQP